MKELGCKPVTSNFHPSSYFFQQTFIKQLLNERYCTLCGTAKTGIKLSLLLYSVELVGSFKIHNLPQFFNILTFGEVLWQPMYNLHRGYGCPCYRVNGHVINACSIQFIVLINSFWLLVINPPYLTFYLDIFKLRVSSCTLLSFMNANI